MTVPLMANDILEYGNHSPPPKLIKKPKCKRKHKSWFSYYNWWIEQQSYGIWISMNCDNPYKREQYFID